MQDEAEITINGVKLTMVRVAIDTLANALADGAWVRERRIALTDRYMTSLSRIQTLLENRDSHKQ
jgi:hypothetical protein